MEIVKWAGAGAIGAMLGAGIWVLVGYLTGYEVGWIAWGVGIFAGFGVRVGAGDDDGWIPGIIAVICATIGVLAGKYFVFKLVVSDLANQTGISSDAITSRISFTSTFGPYDLLWIGLAAFTAFKLGSGAISSD